MTNPDLPGARSLKSDPDVIDVEGFAKESESEPRIASEEAKSESESPAPKTEEPLLLSLLSKAKVKPGKTGQVHHKIASGGRIVGLAPEPGTSVVSLSSGDLSMFQNLGKTWDELIGEGRQVYRNQFLTLGVRNDGEEERFVKVALYLVVDADDKAVPSPNGPAPRLETMSAEPRPRPAFAGAPVPETPKLKPKETSENVVVVFGRWHVVPLLSFLQRNVPIPSNHRSVILSQLRRALEAKDGLQKASAPRNEIEVTLTRSLAEGLLFATQGRKRLETPLRLKLAELFKPVEPPLEVAPEKFDKPAGAP